MIAFSILIVDDEQDIRMGLKALLEHKGYEVATAKDGLEALSLFKEYQYAMVFSDIMMPNMSGIDLTKQVKAINPDTIVILFTGYSSIESAVEAIKSGAEEYLLKPVNNDDVINLVARVYKSLELKRDNEMMRQELLRSQSVQIIGKSDGIKQVRKGIEQAAESDIPVLITGETGTGKDIIARSIHDQGPRKRHPFVAINCGSVSSEFLERELFGYEQGAFPGAEIRKYGLFEVANKGTILLDEIGEMSIELQAKILRAIESKQFRRLGAQDETSSDFRVISSTNRNLLTLIEDEKFREDLFLHLSAFTIDVPALSKRTEDIPLLVDYFSKQKGRQDPKSVSESGFIKALQNYDWPGNVRELKNTLERVFLLVGQDPPTVEYLPLEINDVSHQFIGGYRGDQDRPTLAQIERDCIVKTMHELGGNKTHVAKALGISLRSLYDKLEKAGLKYP